VLTRKFPVVGEKAPASVALDLASWSLEIGGLVVEPRSYSWEELGGFAQQTRTVDIHCVTGWSRLGSVVVGAPLRDLLELVVPEPAARFVRFIADSAREHDTSLPLELALEDTWLVHSVDGAPLSMEHGFPLRTLTPSRYFYKSLKWVRRIELLAEDRLGFWERESRYHNDADPWRGDQRFATGSIDPRRAERFRTADDFARWRQEVLIGLELRSWRPRTRDLHGLRMKLCDLRGAQLAGCDLRGVNLSLSDLRDADLRGADLRDGDLEGANFAGADLRDADISGCALSATRFFEGEGEAKGEERREAQVAGLRWEGTSGLLGAQEAFLTRDRS
jgi:DMSO/TMAO reductase YedYZ molybdopterin-dependent catalytic subunit